MTKRKAETPPVLKPVDDPPDDPPGSGPANPTPTPRPRAKVLPPEVRGDPSDPSDEDFFNDMPV